MAKHINIPIFIPHEGCPNNCVFCNQHTITGEQSNADRDIRIEIDRALSTYCGKACDAEIAFFGGSFTGIDRELMIRLLDTAYEYVKKSLVSAIRLSTRPDYIDNEILEILKERGVTDIELGLQSMRDRVLLASRRGHDAKTAESACTLIKKYGFNLTGQMMIGLPLSTLDDEIYTAEKIVRMGCDSARIYPTVVFEDTELCRMAKNAEYTPINVDEAVNRGARVYSIFVKNAVKVLRIGLQSTKYLSSGEKVYSGANHSALGELVVGEYYYGLLLEKLDEISLDEEIEDAVVEIYCAFGEQSKVAGQKKKNRIRLEREINRRGLKIKEIRIMAKDGIQENMLDMAVYSDKNR